MNNIQMPLLCLDTTREEQYKKIFEEVVEADTAINSAEEKKELADVIQATLGRLRQIATDEEIRGIFSEHSAKLLGRGWKIEGFLELTFRYMEVEMIECPFCNCEFDVDELHPKLRYDTKWLDSLDICTDEGFEGLKVFHMECPECYMAVRLGFGALKNGDHQNE